MTYVPFLERVLNQADEIALSYYGNVSAEVKPEDNNQVLTEADTAIGKYIVSEITREYPGHNVIDEEAGIIDNQSSVTWVVDPIDGTSNFAAATPLYGVMIGVLENDTPIAGGIILPALKELYLAESGKGATCNGARIRASAHDRLSDMLISYGVDGYPASPELTYAEAEMMGRIILAIRNLRTSNSVFDIMNTAKGSYGAFLNKTSKIWDNVAPQVVVQEAGGVYTDFYGQPIDYSNAVLRAEENFTVCAASPVAHIALQNIIHS